jgi:hypothetical protein
MGKEIENYCIVTQKHDYEETDKADGFIDVGMKYPHKTSQSIPQYLITIQIKYAYGGLMFKSNYSFLVNAKSDALFADNNNMEFVNLREQFIRNIFEGIVVFSQTIANVHQPLFSIPSNRELSLLAKNIATSVQ